MGRSLPKEDMVEWEYIPKHTRMEMDHVHIRQIKIVHLSEGLSGYEQN